VTAFPSDHHPVPGEQDGLGVSNLDRALDDPRGRVDKAHVALVEQCELDGGVPVETTRWMEDNAELLGSLGGDPLMSSGLPELPDLERAEEK
jgi:hypothetical protein